MKNIHTRHGYIKCKYCKHRRNKAMYCNRTHQRIETNVIGCSKGIA